MHLRSKVVRVAFDMPQAFSVYEASSYWCMRPYATSVKKKKVVRVAFDMLRAKAEQEQAMLFLLVNKLGDPDKQVAAKVSHVC